MDNVSELSAALENRNKQLKELVEVNKQWQQRYEQENELIRRLQLQIQEQELRLQQHQLSSPVHLANAASESTDTRIAKLEADNASLRRQLEQAKKRLEDSERQRLVQDEQVAQGRQAFEHDIEFLRAQLDVYKDDFETERRSRLDAETQLEQTRAELTIARRQLQQYSLQQMQSTAQRRQASLEQYRLEYERTHPHRQQQQQQRATAYTAGGGQAYGGRSVYQSDGVVERDDLGYDPVADGEDQID